MKDRNSRQSSITTAASNSAICEDNSLDKSASKSATSKIIMRGVYVKTTANAIQTIGNCVGFAFRLFSAILFFSLVLAVSCYLAWKWQR